MNRSFKANSSTGGREPRIAILVLGCLMPIYDRCIKVIRATWGAKTVENVDIFYVYGGQTADRGPELVDIEALIGRPRPQLRDGEAWISGDVILCGAADVREGQEDCILRKRLIAFGHLANQRCYDFVYNVCATSYVDVDQLKRYVGDLPATGVYHGVLHVHPPSGYPFLSGASFLLSRDIAAELANSAGSIISAYPEVMPDDVVIGHFIAERFGSESADEISRRIVAGRAPTNDQTFVPPQGDASVDFVSAPEFSQTRREQAFHYHFNSRRIWEMENFHRRFFAA